ncbi:MAG TPA: hypothetical protein VJA18_05785, partial [Candidatus Nanoarchaeia archaeon]|nr:hypothetical protein [Candidatus Nanoarchaeia archaeon]
EEQFLKNPTPENFNKLNSADQLRFLKNENNYRADLAIEFYKNENNVGLDSNVDVKYFGDKNNVGKNPAADEKFYSSNYAGATTETLRDFLRTGLEQKEAAAKYFSDKFPAEFEFKEIAEGFRYDAATGLLKNGEDSVNVNNLNYKKIIAVKDGTKFGFDFVDEKGREIRIVGEAGREERIIDLQDDKIIFTNSQQIFVQEFTILKNEPTSFSYNKDGTLEVKGPVKGIVWTDSNNYVDFTNRVGTLVIKPNGDFKAENAEILTRKIYVDGKAEKVGNLITAQDHVDRKLKDTDENEQSIKKRQNIDPEGRTVVVDRTSRVGVKTQGQTGENNVKIHLDELPPSDSDASDKIPSLEEAKKIARDIRPREGDLVNNAEVWIQKDERGTSVIAKGKVDVGFYDVGLNGGISSDIRKKEPHFTGHNGKSELELKLGTRTEISLRGKVDYSDDKYSTAEGEKFGIQTVEDGASLKITRNEDSKEDFIYANCFDCESGINAIRIQKTIVSGDPHVIPGVIKNREANSITFVLRVDENGKLGYYPAQDRGLGILAQAQTEGKNVGIGRGLDLQFPCGDKDCYVQIKEERGLGTTQVFYEEFNGKTTRTIPIDTGYGTVLGEAKVIISAKDEENLNKLLTLAKTKQLQAAARLEFSDDPALRKLISQKLGIDVSKLNDKAYLKTFEDSARYHLLVQEGYDRLSKLDINPEDKEKLDAVLASRGIKPELAVAFDIYTKILENKKRRELADLEAAAKSCQGNPTACSFTPAQLKAKQEKAQKDLISAVNKREAAYREFKQREW